MQYTILLFAILALLLSLLFTFIRRIVDGETAIEGLWQRGHPNHMEMIGLLFVVICFICSIIHGIYTWSSG